MVKYMIKTFADCPFRKEEIRTLEQILKGWDWNNRMCPDRCPVSPRNADYSICLHPKRVKVAQRHCPAYYRDENHSPNGTINTEWCEVNTAHRICPMGYAR
jgi:hypothetical protein